MNTLQTETNPNLILPEETSAEDDPVLFGWEGGSPPEFVCSIACFERRYGTGRAAIYGPEDVYAAVAACGPTAAFCAGCLTGLLRPSGRETRH